MNYYLAMWCVGGFESIVDISEYQPEILDKKNIVNKLKGTDVETGSEVGLLINRFTLRARFNPQRFYEVYGFMSTVDLDTLKEVSLNEPQVLVNSIRETGVCLFDGRDRSDGKRVIV